MRIATLLCLASAAIWCVLIWGRARFWRIVRAAPRPAPARWPPVVAIVPARDEAAVIGDAIASLLAQDYRGHFHIVLVDDHSSDGTGELARRAAECNTNRSSRALTVIQASDLPAGWSGKVWAQAQGVDRATTQWPDTAFLWLTDADIAHGPTVLSQLVACAEHDRLDLVSRMARMRCESWWERAIVPAFVFFFAKLYPFRLVNDRSSRVAAAAGGCMLVRATALARVGGMAAIRGELIDDCSLAARIKTGGAGIELELARDTVSLRPYHDWRSLWQMIARSAYTQLRYSPLLLIGALAGMAVTYVVPPVLVLAGRLIGLPLWAHALAGFAWAAMAVAYRPMLREYGQRGWLAPLLPLVALFFMGATWASAWRYWRRRGGQWKGRVQAPVRP